MQLIPGNLVRSNKNALLFLSLSQAQLESIERREQTTDSRVKSSKFRRLAKFGQRPCLFHILIIRIKN